MTFAVALGNRHGIGLFHRRRDDGCHAGCLDHVVEITLVLQAIAYSKLVRLGIAPDHPFAHVLEIAAVHAASLDHVIQRLLVDPGFGTRRIGFRPNCRVRHGDKVVDQLDLVAVAQRAHVDDVFSPSLDQRPQLFQGLCVRADECVQAAFLGFLRRAAKRRVDQLDTDGLQFRSKRQCGGWVRGRRVHHDGPPGSACCNAGLAANQFFDLHGRRYANEYDIACLGQCSGSLGFLRTSFDQVRNRLAVLVAHDCQFIAGLQYVFGHSVAHQADTDKSDAWFSAHDLVSLLLFLAMCEISGMQVRPPQGCPVGRRCPD